MNSIKVHNRRGFRISNILIGLLGLCSITLHNNVLHAQSDGDNVVTQQFWADYNPTFKLTDQFDLKNAVGYRTVTPHDWGRIFLRSALKYKPPQIMLKALKYKEELYCGLDMFYTNNRGTVNRLELTPFQAYSLTLPNRLRLNVKHYIKLEERFEMETDDWINTFGLRLSYEASLTFKFQGDIVSFGKGFYLPVSAKFYWNLIGTNQFNDKLRITPGLGYVFSPQWQTAFFIGYNYSRHDPQDSFHSNDMIFRLRVYHKIN